MDFVRGASSFGFPNYSGKSQGVKTVGNDSEVDERLKNIEPKMVELITNEVRKWHELTTLYSHNFLDIVG